MDIYVLSPAFKTLEIIDYCASIIWTRRYCAAGDFELYIPATASALAALQDGNLVVRDDDPTSLMVIRSVTLETDEENGDFLTVSGPSVESYIAKRIVWKQTNLSGIVTACVTQLLNENLISPSLSARKIPNIQIGTYCSCTTSITKQVTGDNLLDCIIGILSTYHMGFRLVYNSDSTTLEFEIYEGTDRSYDQTANPHVTFSPEFDNILSSEYSASSENYRNVALVAGEGEGVARKTYVVGSASGLNRSEIFVDAREISSDTEDGTLTTDQYNALLAEKGNESLAETIIEENFESTVDATINYQLNVDYFLGDIVNIENQYGITKIARITEIIESWDENGYSCIPTFESEEV